MAFKQRSLWLILIVPGSLLFGVLSRAYDSAILRVVGLLSVVAMIVLYSWPFRKKRVPARGGQLSEHGKRVVAKREHRAQEKLRAARASVSSYRPLVEEVSRALGIDESDSWARFSEAFSPWVSVDDGLQAAFGRAPQYACFDWKDVDSQEEFMHRASHALNLQAPALTEHPNSTEEKMRVFADWLRERGCTLFTIDTDGDDYHCLVLHQRDAARLVNVTTPSGVSVVSRPG